MAEIQQIGRVEIKGRKYPFFSDGTIGTMIRINDEAQPYLAYLARTFPKEFNRALRHVGWWLHKELKEACLQGGPPGHRWPALSLMQRGRWFENYKTETMREIVSDATGDERKALAKSLRRMRSLTPWPFGELVRAIGYKHEPEKQRVRIGWLSKAAARRGAELQKGFETAVTPKMRRFWWAADAPLAKETRILRTPARPLFEPMFRAKEREIHERIENRIRMYLKTAKRKLRFNWAALK